MDTFNFYTPDAELEEKERLRTAQFGDGYAQESSDGLNSLLQVWTLNYRDQYKDQVLAIRAFLKNQKGAKRFYYVTPLSETITVKCKSGWKISRGKDNLLNIGPLVFEQVP